VTYRSRLHSLAIAGQSPNDSRTTSGLRFELSRLTQFYERIAFAILVGIDGMLGFAYIPSFPPFLGIFLAFSIALVSLRSIRLGILGLAFFLGLSYAFQFGALIGNFSGLFVVIGYLFVGIMALLTSEKPANAIGTALGILMALVLLTPYFVVAVPLMVLFVTSYRRMDKKTATIAFLQFYVPLQLLAIASTGEIPPPGQGVPLIYSQITGSFFPPAETLTFSNLLGPISNGSEGLPGVTNAFTYWTVRYFVGSFSMFALIILLSASVSASFMFERFMNNLHQKGFDFQQRKRVVPFISNFIGCMVFALPLSILAGSFGFSTALTENLGQYLGLVIIGSAVTTSVRLYSYRVEDIVTLREDMKKSLEELSPRLDIIEDQVLQVLTTCKNIRIQDLQLRLKGARSEVELTTRTYRELGIPALQQKRDMLQAEAANIEPTTTSLKRRTIDYYLTTNHKFREIVERISVMGFQTDVSIDAPIGEEVETWELQQVLDVQQRLDKTIEGNMRNLVETTQSVYELVRRNFDQEYTLTGVEIARNFLLHHEMERAVDSALQSLELMNEKYSETTADTAKRLQSLLDQLSNILELQVKPLSNVSTSLYFQEIMPIVSEAQQLKEKISTEAAVLHLTAVFGYKEKLVEILEQLIIGLGEKLRAIAQDVDARLPKNYSWGKQEQMHDTLTLTVRRLKEAAMKPTKEFFDGVESSLKILQEEATLIDHYLLTLELILNYPNIDSYLSARLLDRGIVPLQDLPFQFGDRYLRLYATYHKNAIFDEVKSALVHKDGRKR